MKTWIPAVTLLLAAALLLSGCPTNPGSNTNTESSGSMRTAPRRGGY